MITAVDRLSRIKERYEQWEHRQVATRFSAWSVRRRLATFVLLPMMLLCCCGGVAGVPALWIGRETFEAGRGGPSPDAAANEYLMALSYGDEDGLLTLLAGASQDELLAQWRGYRAEMRATDPPPSRLDFGPLMVGSPSGGIIEVRVEVNAVWWKSGDNGRVTWRSRSPRPWVIATQDDDGWRVVNVTPPPWCGPAGYVQRCPGDPQPTSSVEAPSVTPSLDARNEHRNMLRCGDLDPFRELHSCPRTTE